MIGTSSALNATWTLGMAEMPPNGTQALSACRAQRPRSLKMARSGVVVWMLSSRPINGSYGLGPETTNP